MNEITEKIFSQLTSKGIEIKEGLSQVEIATVEHLHQFQFPNDLKAFLMAGLPISFPDWKNPLSPILNAQLDWPIEGILFDVEHNDFWWREWSQKPALLTEQLRLAESYLRSYPKMIPLCAHRFFPSFPAIEGNSVYSIHQTDIILYGADLYNYLQIEFGLKLFKRAEASPKQKELHQTPFWTELYIWSNQG